jgi:hypothetical protein
MSSERSKSETMLQDEPFELTTVKQPRNNPYNQGYMPNGAAPHQGNPVPGATPLLPNQGRVIQSGPIRVLCIADVRGANAHRCPRPHILRFLTVATQATSGRSTISPSRPVPTTSSTPATSASTMNHLWSALLRSKPEFEAAHGAY